MRFLTFIKQAPDPVDPDMIAFKKWFLVSKTALNNPHAGISQIKIVVHFDDVPDAVLNGFYKWEELYQKSKG